MKTTKTEKLAKALAEGNQLTSKQIQNRFGVANPRAHISYIRTKGMKIKHSVVNGVGKYSLASKKSK